MDKTSTGKELLEATQNAVMEAAQNVSNMIGQTTHEIEGHNEAFYMGAEFWVAAAFVLVVVALAQPVGKTIAFMLRKRISNIINRIDEASQLQVDAQKLLAEYQRKFLNAQDEANEILKKAQKEVEYVKTESLSKLEQEMKIKTNEADEKLNSAKEKAAQEITTLTSELTIKAVRQTIFNKLGKSEKSKLIDNSIALLEKLKV